jgi:dTDP-glucose pyrophosphorylase/CBS domain-containing protein
MTRANLDPETLLRRVIVSPQLSVSEAIPLLDRAGMGALLLCQGDRKLIGILTDGDIRRAIMRGVSFEQPCMEIASREPVVAPANVSPSQALHLMDHNRDFLVNHLPVVDKEGRVVDLLLRRDLITQDQTALSAVIMAGGFGTRLRPLTEGLPKPMLPVGGRPVMEQVIQQLREAGIRRVNVATHYKSQKIVEYFGDGRAFGIELCYTNEDRPLGTAGALGLMPAPQETLLVINGDLLTRVDFRVMLGYHRRHGADLTMAVRRYEMQVPYGVLECEGSRVCRLQEKPQLSFLVNAGIYLLEPVVYEYIPKGQSFDMTDLIQRLLDAERSVVGFPVHEYWLDIGQHADYEQAQADLGKEMSG